MLQGPFTQVWDLIVEFATATGIKLVLALLLLLIGMRLIKVLVRRFSRSATFSRIDPSAQSFIRSFASIVLTITLVLTAASIVGVPMTSVMAVLASAGLAIGLALQGALGNLAGGLIILIFKPFRVGDFVDTQAGSGTVREINIFYTILVTPDNQVVTIPNDSLTKAAIVNYTSETTRRLNLELAVPDTTDMEKARQLLLDLVSRHPDILAEPAPFCRVIRHNRDAQVFVLRAWCATDRYWDTYFDLMESIKISLGQQGIRLVHPEMDVRLTK